MVLRVKQGNDEIVDISGWEIDPDYSVYPEGSQPKRLLISPAGDPLPFLLPSHKYLFKVPVGWQQNQIWSEMIAYEMSRFIDVSVPPCFLAVDQNTGEVGILVEFFYGYPGEPSKRRLVPGSDYIHAWLRRDYDRRKGRPHAIRANLTIARALGIDDYDDWWGRTLFFDALIGNVDRHPDNWGFILSPVQGPNYTFEFAPLFDNGTSLGYGATDLSLENTIANLDAYINKGRHHCSWDAAALKGSPHIQMCGQFREQYRHPISPAEIMIRFGQAEIDSIVDWCLAFDSQIAFTAQRAAFVRASLRRRRELLIALGA